MVRYKFPIGHKFGGKKPSLPYKTKPLGIRVPVDIHSECITVVKNLVEKYKFSLTDN